jgi:uncharacterized protein
MFVLAQFRNFFKIQKSKLKTLSLSGDDISTKKIKLSTRKIISRCIKIIIILYCAIGLILYYFQENFLFHPKKLPSNFSFTFNQKFEEINIVFNKTDTMNLVKFYPSNVARKGIVLYYHGNMENILHYADYVKIFTDNGYEVWMEDYPSFGKSTGEITERKLYDQALQIKKMADQKIGSDSIIIYGKSIGTGIAAYVASNAKAKMLVLETPYYSIPSLFATYAFIYPTNRMSTYKIPTYEYLQDVLYTTIIFHGTDDGVIPYKNAKRLETFLKPIDKFVTVSNATHQDINKTKTYTKTIDSLLEK